MYEIIDEELEQINAGCGFCYVGAAAVVAGGILTGGPVGGIVAIVGVSTVLLVSE